MPPSDIVYSVFAYRLFGRSHNCGANLLVCIRKRRLLRIDWWTDLLSQDMLESLALKTTKSVTHQSVQFGFAVTNQGPVIRMFIEVAYTLNHHVIMSIIQMEH